MATADQVIKAALQEILVQASESPIQASEAQDAIFYLNNMMFDLSANGTSIGYTEISDLSDTITVPAGAISGIIANLAVELHTQFSAMNTLVKPDLRARAQAGLKTMLNISFTSIGPMSYPTTLPIGSGNEGDYNGGCQSHYYPGELDPVLTESEGFIATEENTE
jgi:hypothetical protein